MLHDVNAGIPSAEEYFVQEYQRVVRSAGSEPVGRQRAIQEASWSTKREIEMGNVDEPEIISTLKRMGEGIDAAQGRAADKIINSLATGQVSMFDTGEVLDTVVTLGGGMRKSWRFITDSDLADMYEIRRLNHDKQVEAFKRFQLDYEAVRPVVQAFGTVEAAVAAGAFGTEAAA